MRFTLCTRRAGSGWPIARPWGTTAGVPRIALASLSLLMVGCGFGGPLVGDGDAEADADAEESDADADSTGGEDTETGFDTCGPSEAIVDWVVDGDTIILVGGERVRYILVDTPETTNGKDECWGQEATEFNASLVLDQTISLEYDEECRDQYGRLLAYVSVQDYEVNRLLIEEGHACVLYIPPNGAARFSEFQMLENTASANGTNMWGDCDPVPCD